MGQQLRVPILLLVPSFSARLHLSISIVSPPNSLTVLYITRSKMANSRIQELSDIIAISVTKIQQGFTERNLPLPSFDEDSPTTFPLELIGAQDAVIDASSELQDLLMDPMASIQGHGGVRILPSFNLVLC